MPAAGWTQQPFDVLHYAIHLNLTNLSARTLSGKTTVTIRSAQQPLQQVSLSLLSLQVDSVRVGNQSAPFTNDDTLILISLPQPVIAGDSAEITIWYHGQPVTDASWGGFYFTGNYAFNIGVGFDSEPHNFGRVWFPCIDNFTDKATYDIQVTTAPGYKAYCSGVLQDAITHPDQTITWHWAMRQPIPTYLASVAVSPYTELTDTYFSRRGDSVPVILAAQPADTSKLRSSFIHLRAAFDAFEACFGPYRFDRVGFVVVPFSGGAMEHATNIAYPRFAITGNLNYETLMAHEFSHHWWGNLVTCTSAEDMWLNEGWAVYAEHIFLEKTYGKPAYQKAVRSNHREVLQYAHIRDNGYRAVSGVPHAYTYGSTVYKKGADVAHTLRGYLGDSLFFNCLTAFLDSFQFGNASSYDFRDFLSQCSGVHLQTFFDNWVFHPGFPHFSIDSLSVQQTASGCEAFVWIRQRLKEAPVFYTSVPLELTFFSSSLDSVTQKIIFPGGDCVYFQFHLDFYPAFVALDLHEKISDAITDKYLHITDPGSYDFEEALMTVYVSEVPTEAILRIEHNWIAPDPGKTSVAGLHISSERYWKIDGVIPAGFTADAVVQYDGATLGSTDYGLITNSEDSLVVLYRAKPGMEWMIHPAYSINTQGSSTNKKGQITINQIAQGEYALAIRDFSRQPTDTAAPPAPCVFAGINLNGKHSAELDFEITPNPVNDSFLITFSNPLKQPMTFSLISLYGARLQTGVAEAGTSQIALSASGLYGGTYLWIAHNGNTFVAKKLIVIH
ncbi:MAG: hypothetical protein KatS3mg031_0709 [Chitinophagales bacterium]|nr:MAG: hypothetical protein KatS3mg031_0709 [Chitinophagales bacterium]